MDIYQTITDQIIEALEKGEVNGKWQKPWNTMAGLPINAVTNKAYSGVNVLTLWAQRESRNYTSNIWATFKQWKSLGAQLKVGQNKNNGQGGIACFKMGTYTKEDDSGKERTSQFARAFWLFNLEQIEGWEPKNQGEAFDADKEAEKVIAESGAKIVFGSNSACWIPSLDEIHSPNREEYFSVKDYYGTIFHELGHWTGDKKRLDRNMKGRFGDESYAMEELVAELCASFTCANIGVEGETPDNHTKYISNWLKVLKNDKRAIVTAASAAQKATNYILKVE